MDSGTTMVGTAGPDPGTDPGTVRTKPRPEARPGRTEAKAAGAAGMEVGREAPEAVMVDTRAAATAAMMPQAREAVETAGEVAGVVGMGATPPEVATASSSHSQL